ncbi:MAG: PEP-CTERM sorting domain-containing protein [Deltaproteobacteria bacterium]|nr:PEP-CTERM sorting domain-containing protein [Deltaproteobacteria bacterium]
MKKLIFLLCSLLLMLCSFSNVSAATIGNALIERPSVDSWSNFNVIDTSLQLTDDGVIDSWSIRAQFNSDGGSNVYFQILRLTSADTYTIIGENEFMVGDTQNVQTFTVADSDKISYQSGDFIGWAFSGKATFGFAGNTGNNILHSHSDNSRITGAGTVIDVANFWSTNRIYSISADTSPVPEPATMILFSIALIGLTGVSRKRQ